MTYVIEHLGPPVGWRNEKEGYQLQANEVAIVDAPPQPGQVWDATNKRFRDPTTAEALSIARAAKKLEMERMFGGESSLAELAQALIDPSQQAALRTRVGKLNAKKNQIDNATSPSAIDSVVW